MVEYKYIELVKSNINKADLHTKNTSKKNNKTKTATLTNMPIDFKILQIENCKNSLKKDLDELMDKSKGLKRYLFARVGKIEHNNFLRFNNDVKSFLNNCIDTFGNLKNFDKNIIKF